MTSIALVVPAAGRGERLGHGIPKALVELQRVSLLQRAVLGAVEAFVGTELADISLSHIVVAIPDGFQKQFQQVIEQITTVITQDHGYEVEVSTVLGGNERFHSVDSALRELPEAIDFVLVHDAARALTPREVFTGVVGALRDGAQAVIPALPVSDTIKTVVPHDAGEDQIVRETLPRQELRAVQTPQGFSLQVLKHAYRQFFAVEPGSVDNVQVVKITDDASLIENLGGSVSIVPGAHEAMKITTPWDLWLAEALLQREGR